MLKDTVRLELLMALYYCRKLPLIGNWCKRAFYARVYGASWKTIFKKTNK